MDRKTVSPRTWKEIRLCNLISSAAVEYFMEISHIWYILMDLSNIFYSTNFWYRWEMQEALETFKHSDNLNHFINMASRNHCSSGFNNNFTPLNFPSLILRNIPINVWLKQIIFILYEQLQKTFLILSAIWAGKSTVTSTHIYLDVWYAKTFFIIIYY